jgi:hypothetical protein
VDARRQRAARGAAQHRHVTKAQHAVLMPGRRSHGRQPGGNARRVHVAGQRAGSALGQKLSNLPLASLLLF